MENLDLFGGGLVKGLVDQPGALVVLDIGTDLADDLGLTVTVEVVVLDLEVLTEGQENILSLLEGSLILDTGLLFITISEMLISQPVVT
jgi:hypothetical protein